MTTSKVFAALTLLLALSLPALTQEGARDADAVLNRCGKPFKGDSTLYTNEGSTRTLEYERGTLIFTRVGNEGWKFVSGSRKKQSGLTVNQMAAFLPCLPLALADSASPAPLRNITPVERIEVSAKQSYKTLILYTFIAVLLIALILFAMSRRTRHPDEE